MGTQDTIDIPTSPTLLTSLSDRKQEDVITSLLVCYANPMTPPAREPFCLVAGRVDHRVRESHEVLTGALLHR